MLYYTALQYLVLGMITIILINATHAVIVIVKLYGSNPHVQLN